MLNNLCVFDYHFHYVATNINVKTPCSYARKRTVKTNEEEAIKTNDILHEWTRMTRDTASQQRRCGIKRMGKR